jgi:hypothetical protein
VAHSVYSDIRVISHYSTFLYTLTCCIKIWNNVISVSRVACNSTHFSIINFTEWGYMTYILVFLRCNHYDSHQSDGINQQNNYAHVSIIWQKFVTWSQEILHRNLHKIVRQYTRKNRQTATYWRFPKRNVCYIDLPTELVLKGVGVPSGAKHAWQRVFAYRQGLSRASCLLSMPNFVSKGSQIWYSDNFDTFLTGIVKFFVSLWRLSAEVGRRHNTQSLAWPIFTYLDAQGRSTFVTLGSNSTRNMPRLQRILF